MLFFFFKQKTAYELRISDWSSDVCSSDLLSRSLWRRSAGLTARSTMRRSRRPDCRLPKCRSNGFGRARSEEHTSELQSLMRNSYDVFCLKKKKHKTLNNNTHTTHKIYERQINTAYITHTIIAHT